MKNFGFGCMRLPMQADEIDLEQFKKMEDRFLAEGFTYFDTAHGYHSGKSEIAVREGLVKRYPRDAYLLTDKLTENYFDCEGDIIPFCESQLEITGAGYFDYYLLHSLTRENYRKFVRCRAFDAAVKLKEAGKIRHIGISFHDKADLLSEILSTYPQIETVQIQFNYMDYDDPGIESRKVYEVCRKFGKPVIVMEPVKGGGLVNLPEAAGQILDQLNGGSYASYAIRYAASFEGVFMVLSGMSTLEQLEDNISYMKHFQPLSEKEFDAIDRVREFLHGQDIIPCTACRYCVDGCPKNIPIPELFSCMNAKKQYKDWNSDFYYSVHTEKGGRASDCIKCGKCERVCPQHLKIRDLLVDVAAVFDAKE